MSDLVERLRREEKWTSYGDGGPLLLEAAAEIERLRAMIRNDLPEIDRVLKERQHYMERNGKLAAQVGEQVGEIERLRAQYDALRDSISGGA